MGPFFTDDPNYLIQVELLYLLCMG